MADDLRHFVQTIYEASDAPAWAHDRAAQLLDMPSLAHGCAKDRADIDKIKERLGAGKPAWVDLRALLIDHNRQAKELADTKQERDEAVTANHAFRVCELHTLEATNPFETSCLVCDLAAKEAENARFLRLAQGRWAEIETLQVALANAQADFANADDAAREAYKELGNA